MGQPFRRGLRGFEAVVDDPPNLGSKKSLDKISQPTHCGHQEGNVPLFFQAFALDTASSSVISLASNPSMSCVEMSRSLESPIT